MIKVIAIIILLIVNCYEDKIYKAYKMIEIGKIATKDTVK